MGSKSRIRQKLRQSAHFTAIEAELGRLGLAFTVESATGSGHPFVLISIPGDAEPLKHSIACTPHQKVPQAAHVSHLRRTLRAAGVEC